MARGQPDVGERGIGKGLDEAINVRETFVIAKHGTRIDDFEQPHACSSSAQIGSGT